MNYPFNFPLSFREVIDFTNWCFFHHLFIDLNSSSSRTINCGEKDKGSHLKERRSAEASCDVTLSQCTHMLYMSQCHIWHMSYFILAQSHNAHIQDKMSYHQMFFSFLMVKINNNQNKALLAISPKIFLQTAEQVQHVQGGIGCCQATATYGGLTPTQFRGGSPPLPLLSIWLTRSPSFLASFSSTPSRELQPCPPAPIFVEIPSPAPSPPTEDSSLSLSHSCSLALGPVEKRHNSCACLLWTALPSHYL